MSIAEEINEQAGSQEDMKAMLNVPSYQETVTQ